MPLLKKMYFGKKPIEIPPSTIKKVARSLDIKLNGSNDSSNLAIVLAGCNFTKIQRRPNYGH